MSIEKKGEYGYVSVVNSQWVEKKAKAFDEAEAELAKEYAIYGALRILQGIVIPKMRADSTSEKLVLEHIRGLTLYEYATSPGLTPQAWAKVIKEVKGCIASFHAQGWAHGDLHSGNVLVSNQEVRLIDLSTARHQSTLSEKEWCVVKTRDYGLLFLLLKNKRSDPWYTEVLDML
jgi:RIO-like serine/threonine protein kinase